MFQFQENKHQYLLKLEVPALEELDLIVLDLIVQTLEQMTSEIFQSNFCDA